MNLLGVHALVFAGSWGRKDRERVVAGAAKRYIQAGWAAAPRE